MPTQTNPGRFATVEEAQRNGYLSLLGKVFGILVEELPLYRAWNVESQKLCIVCGQVIVDTRRKYCSKECHDERWKYKNRPIEYKKKHSVLVARWQTEHPEQAREINSRASAKYQRKKTKLSRFDKMAGEMLEQR